MTMEFSETQVQRDIDALRDKFPNTQDLYREACVLLFFRYGITPTANKLYQFVRKGSMSAPSEALTRFWNDLREKSRVRIESPDLPESLKVAAGELVTTLWTSAQEAAQQGMAALRSEAEAKVVETKHLQQVAEDERDAIRSSHAVISQTLELANTRVSELDQAMAAGKATISSFEGQLQTARGENVGLLQKLEDARRDFAAELEKLGAAANLAEERFRAAETRALMEIDRERMAAQKLQKELASCRAGAEQATERHRSDVAALQEQLGNFRQKTGELEGNLKAVTANRDVVLEDLKSVRNLLEERTARLAAVESEAAELRGQLAIACQAIENQKTAKPARASRKPKTAGTS